MGLEKGGPQRGSAMGFVKNNFGILAWLRERQV